MKRRTHAVGILLTSLIAGTGLTALGSTAAWAGDCNTEHPGDAVLRHSKSTPDAQASIEIYSSASRWCAMGRVRGRAEAEIWVDRQSPYQGVLGGNWIQPPSQTATTGWWYNGSTIMRACGRSGPGREIVCTTWI